MSNEVEFIAWPKIPRATGEKITITEKIDGTNACVVIQEGKIVGIQSRKRFITPESDNYGFASWVMANEKELLKLGDGYHYGEWAGAGIQKNPHRLANKQFFLFNTFRWTEDRPKCCSVIKTLYLGECTPSIIEDTLCELKHISLEENYVAEGIVVYYHKTKRFEKYTYDYIEGKWANK